MIGAGLDGRPVNHLRVFGPRTPHPDGCVPRCLERDLHALDLRILDGVVALDLI